MLRHLRCLLPLLAVSTLLVASACQEMPTTLERVEISSAAPLFANGTGLPPFNERMAELGDMIFDDPNLSINRNQACNSCHEAAWGFTGPDADTNRGGAVYEGSIPGRFGDRKPPSSAYSTLSPVFGRVDGLFVGGNFWDGRATGARFGDPGGPAIEQAQGPFLNHVEQGLRDEACVVYRVSRASYAGLYKQVFGNAIESIGFPADIDSQCSEEGGRFGLGVINATNRAKIEKEYDNIAIAIAMYEESHNLFSSKFDAVQLGRDRFTGQERRGFDLFKGKANCANCHTIDGPNPAFTDHTFDNLGVPSNPDNPAGSNYRDPGLGGFLTTLGPQHPYYAFRNSEMGKMRVPTLRNVALMPKHKGGNPKPVKAYMHNGAFKDLEEVVKFYNTRDVLRPCGARDARKDWGKKCWPAPQFPETMNRDELGNLGLTQGEVNAIVAFLGTLSDGHFPRRKGKHFAGD